jgi:cysteine desulfurase
VPSATIRFGLGRQTTEADIDYTIEKFAAVVKHLRDTAPRLRQGYGGQAV